MKRLQTTQKRAYTSPVMEVLETENDMPLLVNSQLQRENLSRVTNTTFSDTDGGLGAEEVEE